MTTNESKIDKANVCDLNYLSELMGGKKHLIEEIMDVFLKQVPEELQSINDAIEKINYAAIKGVAHTMKSSVSIMGISVLIPILQEMEDLGSNGTSIEKIKELNRKLILLCNQAIEEIKIEKSKFI
jgi:HPt (histidine-containing phosphotransfer) domain-containing protein